MFLSAAFQSYQTHAKVSLPKLEFWGVEEKFSTFKMGQTWTFYKAQLDSTISYTIKEQFTSASLITLKNHFEE
jgi:hypothetical protein